MSGHDEVSWLNEGDNTCKKNKPCLVLLLMAGSSTTDRVWLSSNDVPLQSEL